MSDKINPSGENNFTTVELLPKYYQTNDNKKFLQATLDQLAQKGTAKKVNGYIGRKSAKSASGKDIYIDAVNSARQNYQLEPSVVIKDSADKVTFFKDYQDYINQLNIFGSDTSNHERINKQEFYSWDPHINWDMLVNFQQYYWLPYGPDTIAVTGQQLAVSSTYTVNLNLSVTNNKEFLFTPDGISSNPTITLYRGQTYKFEITSAGEPFSIKTLRTLGSLDRYTENNYIDNFGVETGVITFTVPLDSPDTLYYVSERDPDLGGLIKFADIDDSSIINIEMDLLGKKSYILPNGTPLSNGMKLKFEGNVQPDNYASGEYYVEGVGTAIKLVPARILEIISPYTTGLSVLFDTTPFDQFPFAAADTFAGNTDYMVVNRSSIDRNPWSRYNRWFHKDTITASATYNNKLVDLDQTKRAVRPIIEFEANLKLFNFGSVAIADVDLVDDFTTDVFTTIEGTAGYSVDKVSLIEGMRVLFTADTDSLVRNNIYKVQYVNIQNSGIGVPQLRLILDETPVKDTTVIIRQGSKYQGTTFWYNGTAWNFSQQKTKTNQAPLFDLYDSNAESFSTYSGSTFAGTKLFSYKERETVPDQRGDKPFSLKVGSDATLGFPLSFRNIENIGDILFDFNLLTGAFEYKGTNSVLVKAINTGYLSRLSYTNVPVYVNGWQTSQVSRYQPAVRIYKDSNLVNNFPLDIYDNKSDLADLEVRPYLNGIKVDAANWTLIDAINYKQIKFIKDINSTDVLTIKSFAKQPINSNGFYEIPINLQNNPLNTNIGYFTLGEVTDHVNSIVDNISSEFTGSINGSNNLRDLGNVTQFGTKFVQHSGPTSLALYHITSEQTNILKAIEKSRDDYNTFKRNFTLAAYQIGQDLNVVDLVDSILQTLSANKTNQSPYYFSGMIPTGGKKTLTYTVEDLTISEYPLSRVFNNDVLSNLAVNVYIDNEHLLYERDYVFTTSGYVSFTKKLSLGNSIVIYEYDSTDGSYVPSTPTKLGLWPKFEPKIYKDLSLLTPKWMIQGHDGSQTLAYGDYDDEESTSDYRDALILELEKRIYNNLQIKYDPSIFDIYQVVPGYYRNNDYSLDEFNTAIAPSFYRWNNLAGQDFAKPAAFDQANTFTYNYKNHTAPDGRPLPGYWRGIYRWVYDTDRPNICPWEMLGFTEEPNWWQDVYGPAPYTNNNTVMWADLAQGAVKAPGMPVEYRKQFARPTLSRHIPVDESGNLVSPVAARLSTTTFTTDATSNYTVGDIAPVEAAWRRSSYYPFSVLIASMLLKPAYTFATCLDRSRTVRNQCGQLVYSDTELRVTPADIILPSIYSSTDRTYASGIVNYIVDLLTFTNVQYYTDYLYNLNNLTINLSYRIGGFTSKENINLILDSKNPASTGNVFVPKENYSLVFNSSSPIKKLSYSGVIITRLQDGYEIKGYSTTESYFKYVPPMQLGGTSINVGGISAPFLVWSPNKVYTVGQLVVVNNQYYRTTFNTTSQDTFDPTAFTAINTLPIVGGEDAVFRRAWDLDTVLRLPYGTVLNSIQQVVDFLLGYGEYLKLQGFVFEEFNNTLAQVSNWETTAKEFMFWTTQKWSSGLEMWTDWTPNTTINYGTIVKYNNEYYKSLINSQGTELFISENFEKLDGLSTVGSAVISLSPAALSLSFMSELAVADNINNPFNEYEIFKVDGSGLSPIDLNCNRQGNVVTYSPDDNNTIYHASFYLIQKEQVLILDNTTIFNDILYHPESGYRQDRIKLAGFTSNEWYGGFEIPGFIFDRADIKQWQPWTDYALGDIVQSQGFYYSANSFTPGTAEFNSADWSQINKPEPKLLPNWNYKANQFEDFYDLDNDSFDTGQQQIAQHLIGYQPRQYLSNIIQSEISEFQFYQGMIREKGTQNSLNKLFDVLSANNKESLSFYEEWALRVGQYGASNAFESLEVILNQPLATDESQGYHLTSNNSVDNPFTVEIPYNAVYLKPYAYNSHPWPVNNFQNYYLRTPGHVQSADNVIQLGSIDEILKLKIADFSEGTQVWVSFEKTSWNILRFTASRISPVSVTYDAVRKEIIIQTETQLDPELSGQYIGITLVDFAGFYKISSVTLNQIIINSDTPIEEQSSDKIRSQMEIFRFYSVRTDSIDTANDIIKSYTRTNDKIWIDKDADNKWSTLQLNSVFSSSEVKKPYPVEDMEHGTTVVMNTEGTLAAVSTRVGQVITYEKQGNLWVFKQLIKQPVVYREFDELENFNTLDMFAESLAMSADGEYLAVGMPRAGKLATVTAANGNTICDISALNATTLQTGVVSLYQKTEYNEYNLIFSIASGDNIADQLFGSTLKFGNNTLFVGSKGNTSYGAQAAVFEIQRNLGTPTELDNWLLKRPGISVVNGSLISFGSTIAVSADNTTLVITAPRIGNIYVYNLISNVYTLVQTMEGNRQQSSSLTNIDGVDYFDLTTLAGGFGFKESASDSPTEFVEGLQADGGHGEGLIVDATVDVAGTIKSVHVRNPGNNYRVGDVVTISNPLGNGAVTSFALPLFSNTNFSSSTTADISPTNTGGGNGLKINVATTKTAGANIGDLIIPVPKIERFSIGAQVFANQPNIFGKIYNLVSGINLSGSGIGAKFDITASDSAYLISIATDNLLAVRGTNYAVNNRIVVPGTALGGTTPINDAIVTVATVGPSGAILTVTIAGVSNYVPKITDLNLVEFDSTVVGTTLTVNSISNGSDDVTAWITASIAGTELTVYEFSGEPLIVGMALTGIGITDGTVIVSGSGNIWTLNNSHDIELEYIKAALPGKLRVGMQVSNPILDGPVTFGASITAGATTTFRGDVVTLTGTEALLAGSVNGIYLTLRSVDVVGTILPNMLLTTSAVNGIVPSTRIVSGSGLQWVLDTNQPTPLATNISSVQITDTNGTLKVSPNDYAVGQAIKVTGSLSAGEIAGYVSGTIYYIGKVNSRTSIQITSTYENATAPIPVFDVLTPTGVDKVELAANTSLVGMALGTFAIPANLIQQPFLSTGTKPVLELVVSSATFATITVVSPGSGYIEPPEISENLGVVATIGGSGGSGQAFVTATLKLPNTATSGATFALSRVLQITGKLDAPTIIGNTLSFGPTTGTNNSTVETGMVLSGGTVLPNTTVVAGAGNIWFVDKAQTSTCTTATSPFATIVGNILTFNTKIGADIAVGMILVGGTVESGTVITGIPPGVTDGKSWIISNNQTSVCTTATSQATVIDGVISGINMTYDAISGIPMEIGMVLSGGTVIAGTYIVSGADTTWQVNQPQTATFTTATPVIMTVTGPIVGTIGIEQTVSGGSVTAGSKIVAKKLANTDGTGTYFITPIQNRTSFSATAGYILPATYITAFGTGTGGTGTYTLSQIPGGIPSRATAITVDSPLINTLVGNAEINSFNIINQGFSYRIGDQITFNAGGTVGIISTRVTSIASNASITVSNIGNGSTINDPDRFGTSVDITVDSEFLAVGNPLYTGTKENQGQVLIYNKTGNGYVEYQTISSPNADSGNLFGSKVLFASDYKTLLVYSPNADNLIPTTFDLDQIVNNTASGNSTIFDSGVISFREITPNTGCINVFDKYNTKWICGETLATDNNTNDGFGSSFAVSDTIVLVGAPHATDIVTDSKKNVLASYRNIGKLHSYEKNVGTYSWQTIHRQTDLVNLSKIKQAFLYNKITNKLVKHLDLIDPILGKIASPAEQELSYKTFYDPAIYSVGNESVNVNAGTAWTTTNVGKLWWDLRTAKFIDNHSESVTYRNTMLSTLATGASIDIYEWVASTGTPADWSRSSDTATGLANGISGQPLYTDSYSIKQTYDVFNKRFTNTYYFWVKNTVIVPSVQNRRISANEVSQLISNPRGSGYQFLALTGTDSFSVINCDKLLSGADVVLSVEYWLVDNTTQNIHAQWKLIDNNPRTVLPMAIEEKWFDSLCGKDQADRPVPDLNLPPKLRYGVESRPRQSMFVNSYEALKQFVERVNLVLIKEQIAEQKNISKLESYDPEPNLFSGEYDVIIDTDAELRLVPVSTAQTAVIRPIIVNGSITGATIVAAGSGYKTNPDIVIKGVGRDAKLKAIVNAAGQITSVEVLFKGKGYLNSTTTTVRPLSVLVRSDSFANGAWSIYSYSNITKTWTRVKTQSYDVRNYWSLVDWYASSYSQFTDINYSIDTFAELTAVPASVGQTVKIRTVGTNGWYLLVRKSTEPSALTDWTSQYNVVGIENGTIQLSSNLYSFQNNNIGYDGSIYDTVGFDFTASRELRIILNTLRADILVDTLKQSYLDLFFASVRYAHAEQTYVDWAFKTSFVKAQHNVGELKQTVTYKNDNLADFQDYISEVLPYRTTVREYVSNYNASETSSTAVTDFDLPAVYRKDINSTINSKVVNGKIETTSLDMQTYPWKNWFDNIGFEITSLVLTSGGSGYVIPPTVRIISNSGSGATAKAFIANGRVNRIILISPGKGYLEAPQVIIDGGSSALGTQATVVAVIGNGVVRSSLIKIKFDRTSSKYYTIQLDETESFIGTGSKTNFALKWAPDIKIGSSTVTINGVSILRDSYTLTIAKSTARGYTSYSGLITFDIAPARDLVITVDYVKDISLLNASDRIQYFYNPTGGQAGKELGQLMTGVDYGGVIVTGVDYNISQGWNSVGFMTDLWDSYENTFNDYAVTIDAATSNSREFLLPYLPEQLEQINVYYAQVVRNTFVSDGITTIYQIGSNYNTINLQSTVIKSIIGATTTVTESSVDKIFATQTIAGFNYVRASTTNLTVDKAVVFTGTVFGGIVSDQTYYVKSIINSTTFIISISIAGEDFILSSATGSMLMRYATPNNRLTGDTSLLAPNMAIQFAGVPFAGLAINTTYFVKTVVSATEFTISNSVNGTVVSLPTSIGTMTAREVAATGSLNIKLNNTDGLKIGDTLSVNVASAIADNTVITRINSNTEITIGTILYGALLVGTEITFQRTLTAPADYRNLTNVTIQLTQPVYVDGVLTISAPLDPIRIDDANYSKIWIITKAEADTNIITTITPVTFEVGDTIRFTGIAFGNLVTDFTYYIKSVPTNRTFTVSNVFGGPVHELTTAVGTMSATSKSNQLAVMATYIADGTEPKIFVPRPFALPVGDIMIFRKSTSDGSISVSDNDIDTALDGGNHAYTSATGLAADDILIDGDGYVTAQSSAGPEEVVPGQVVDAVAIKVYDRPSDGSATVKTLNYIADGITNKFNLEQFPNSKQATVVRVNSNILNINVDYFIDYANRQIVTNAIPVDGSVVTISSFGFNGTNVLDVDYFVADGTTREFITKAPYLDTDFTFLVYLDGVAITPTLFKTDTTYESSNRIGFRFSIAPVKFSVLNYLIVSGSQQSYAIFKTEKLPTSGATVYTLTNTVGSSLPLESSVIVRANQKILQGPTTNYFTIGSNQYTYVLDQSAVQPYTINTTDITVYADGSLLQFINDYSVDTAGVSISLNRATYNKYKGKRLIISIASQQDYTIVGDTIMFNQSYTSNDYVEVISAFKHDILQVRRTKTKATNNIQFTTKSPSYYKYIGVLGGRIELGTTITTESQLLITKNKTLLANGIDYRLTPELDTVVLDVTPDINDEFETIIFAGTPVRPGLSYMLFKDMLNRTVYKRLSAFKQNELAQDLNYYDSTIVVKDAGNFDKPSPALNKPGVIEINGERIEYFTITNNTILGQLRRGTLGTGVPQVHSAGSKVQDIGPSETIPYTDITKSEQLTVNGSNIDFIIPLSFVPTKSSNKWTVAPSAYNLFSSAEISNFVSKTGSGPYAVKFAVQQQSISPAVGKKLIVAGNTVSYNGTYTVLDANTRNQNSYLPTSIGNTTISGTAITVEFIIPVQLTAPEVGIFYNISGTVPLEYNQSWICSASTVNSITLSVTTNFGAITVLPKSIKATSTVTLQYSTDPGTYNTSMVSTVTAPTYSQADDIDVFVGGYDESTVWQANTVFEVEQIVTINSYTYRITSKHRSGATFNSSVTTLDEFNDIINTMIPATSVRTFFVGNIRLKKHPYSIYNVDTAPESPEGDVPFGADFAVDGVNSELVLLNRLTPGTVVTIIRKTGKTWTENNEDLQVSQSKIAKFITAVPGVWVTGNQTTSTATLLPSTITSFDEIGKTFDDNNTTFDQGN